MATIDLIEQAELDKAAAAEQRTRWPRLHRKSSMRTSTATASAKALFDDLSENGPAVTVVTIPAPPVVTLYTAAPPDTYTATILRVAD